jgi:hypothetical protein
VSASPARKMTMVVVMMMMMMMMMMMTGGQAGRDQSFGHPILPSGKQPACRICTADLPPPGWFRHRSWHQIDMILQAPKCIFCLAEVLSWPCRAS